MPIALPKYTTPYRWLVRDVRPLGQRFAEFMDKPEPMAITAGVFATSLILAPASVMRFVDLLAIAGFLFFRWAFKRKFHLPFKIPKYANIPDPRNPKPGTSGAGKAEGILFIGNTNDPGNPDKGQEIWFTNSDARTHILYLGTTGAGKTEGLKAMVTNALAWGSGYVYVDGKADTDLWASLYAVARRFGRDDDLLILNYMTGNSDAGSTSNSMNPFSNGSSSYLANMVVSFMPDAGGDNAMWKERAVALMFALMPALVHKRDHGGMLMDIGTVRDHIEMKPIIRLSRDPTMPARVSHSLKGYLNTLPGFVDNAFDDQGDEKPPSPDQPMYDLQVARQQHGYLSMQFTRALQMLADEYGYIFKAQLADIDVLDVVLNRRILVTLIPALEKSGPEAANLGKIVAASLKGMMGMTLGNTVEGSWENAIGSKQTRSASSFMTVFDEVGYYTAQGMAVMAAQARSLGFSLVFASQDLPSMEKNVKQEAKSIVGNCNIKLFGKLEDPTDTKEFLFKHSGAFFALETTGFQAKNDSVGGLFANNPYHDKQEGGAVQVRQRVDYDHVREQREGQIHMFFGDWIARADMFFVAPERVKAIRVHRFLPVPGANKSLEGRERALNELSSRLKDPEWTAVSAASTQAPQPEIVAMAEAVTRASQPIETGVFAVASLAAVPATRAAARIEAQMPQAQAPLAAPTSNAGNGNGQYQSQGGYEQHADVTMSRTSTVSIPEISPSEKASMRSSLPPLYEGDQYAINDVQRAPSGVGGGVTGFAGTDADYAVVTPVGGEDDAGVMDLTLPEDVAAMLEQSAKKLSKGLTGSEEGRKQ